MSVQIWFDIFNPAVVITLRDVLRKQGYTYKKTPYEHDMSVFLSSLLINTDDKTYCGQRYSKYSDIKCLDWSDNLVAELTLVPEAVWDIYLESHSQCYCTSQ